MISTKIEINERSKLDLFHTLSVQPTINIRHENEQTILYSNKYLAEMLSEGFCETIFIGKVWKKVWLVIG